MEEHALVSDVITSDLNLYWDTSGGMNPEKGSKQIKDSDIKLTQETTSSEWSQEGYNLHSLNADPLFQDLGNFDFKLSKNSPAIALGFKDIDISDIGPRVKDHRKDYFNLVTTEWPYVIEI